MSVPASDNGSFLTMKILFPSFRPCHNDKSTVIARAESPKQSLSPTEIASSLTSFAPRNDDRGRGFKATVAPRNDEKIA